MPKQEPACMGIYCFDLAFQSPSAGWARGSGVVAAAIIIIIIMALRSNFCSREVPKSNQFLDDI